MATDNGTAQTMRDDNEGLTLKPGADAILWMLRHDHSATHEGLLALAKRWIDAGKIDKAGRVRLVRNGFIELGSYSRNAPKGR